MLLQCRTVSVNQHFYVLKSIQPCMADDLNSQMLAVEK